MAILLPGGAGFIGSHRAVELLNAGKEIVIIDNFSNSKPSVLDAIKEITGNPSTLYRGPYGEYNDTVIRSCKRFKPHNNTMVNRYIRL